MIKKIYLLGGYFTNSNYGDVIQARVWIEFYSRRGLKVVLVHGVEEAKLAEFRRFLGNDLLFTHYKSILDGRERVGSDDVVHFYGGGYSNSVWGDIFLETMRKVVGLRAKVLATGNQIDRVWAGRYRQEIGAGVEWISVRDADSRRHIASGEPILCDDSFLHFLGSGALAPLSKPSPAAQTSNAVLAHFNVSGYAVGDFFDGPKPLWHKLMGKFKRKEKPAKALEEKLAAFEGFVCNCLSQGRSVTVLRNFPELPEGVIEAERVFHGKDSLPRIQFKETFAAERECGCFEFGVASSFHAAILMRTWLNIPVYFIALNNYYRQKSAALMDYGVIDEAHLVTRLSQLPALGSSNTSNPGNAAVLERMRPRAEAVQKRVLEVIG